MQRVANAHHIPDADLGIIVREIGAADPLVSLNADVPRNPASAMKIVTVLTALDQLGPAYTWPTEVYALGRIRGDTIDGDLGLKGHGDPYLVTEDLWKLVQGLRRRGVAHIAGDLVVDSSYFTVPDEDPGEFDNRPYHAYNALPNATLVNFQATYFHFYASRNSNKVEIKLEPELPNLRIDNRLTAVDGRCGGFQRGIAMTVPESATADRVIFEGRFPRACGHYVLARSVLTPEGFAFGVFKWLWVQSGGTIDGGVRTGTIPDGRRPILIWHSRPLGDVIRLVNKFSNNVMARNILLTVGAEKFDAPGTVNKGVQAVNEYLAAHDISTAGFNMVNGAGLSRDTRVTPRTLEEVLSYAASIPYAAEFVSSLSIIGMDGTTQKRFRSRREAGHAHLKTGTIDHVSAIAGYVHANSGRQFIVVGLVNHPDAHRGAGQLLWNALIQWAYNQ